VLSWRTTRQIRGVQLLGVRGLVTALEPAFLTLESGDKSPHSKELTLTVLEEFFPEDRIHGLR